MAACVCNDTQLSSDSWLHILSFLNYRDLIRCSEVNRQLNELANNDANWRRQCKRYWLISSCPENSTWKEHFMSWYRDFGRYIHCYAKIRTAWTQISSYLQEKCPRIYESINEGTTEEELNNIEEKINLKLPDDLRCSYRIHDGQRLVCPGLIGSMTISGCYRSESLLNIDTAAAGIRGTEALKHCIPLTFCIHTGVSQYLSLSEEHGLPLHHIIYPSKNYATTDPFSYDYFIAGKNFASWLTEYASQLANDEFPIINKQPFRFLHEPGCVAITGYIQVSVATAFLPEMSSINPPKFLHTYRITISMADDASENESCQLEQRHWIITSENEEERVIGPGVVGEYPVMQPGESYSYISCVQFSTTYGNMKGTYTFRNLKTGDRSEVEIPLFHLRCYPYINFDDSQTMDS